MGPPRALAAPASLKGVLSAAAAASALADGLRTWADVRALPVADGGEGTLDVLHAALGGEWHDVTVHDAFGRLRWARWLALSDGTACVEAYTVRFCCLSSHSATRPCDSRHWCEMTGTL